MSSTALHNLVMRSLLFFVFVVLFSACGAQIEEKRGDGSNFNPDDFKPKDKPITVAVTPIEEKEEGPRDPDGLLYRIDSPLHEHLREVRIDETDNKILVIFKSSEALKLDASELSSMRLKRVADGELTIEVAGKDFMLMYSR